ncbi:MAG: DUF222 domain-containing protein [Gemmatimonadota bacterium]
MGYATGGSSGWTDVVGRGIAGILVRERDAVRYGAAGRGDSDPQGHADPRALPDIPSDLDTLPDLARYRALEPAPDPFEIPDELESLQAAVVTLAAHIHAANYRMLTYIAEFDRLGGWQLAGHRNCAEWLHFHTGIDKGAARERVRAARALPRLPLVSEAMSRGELSFSKVRAVTRLVEDLAPEKGEDAEAAAASPATSAAEAEVLSYARACTTAELERFVQSWRHVGRGDEAELERRRHRSRSLTVSPDGDGMYRIRGTLDPEVGALLMRAIDWASDQLFHAGDDWAPEGGPRGPRTEEVTPRQRRADALGLLAELAMGGGAVSAERAREDDAGSSGDGCGCSDHPPATHTARQRATASRLSSSRPERYTVMLHVDASTLADAGGAHSRAESDVGAGTGSSDSSSAASTTPSFTLYSHLQDGTHVSAETSRRLACDAGVVRITHAADGSILDLGRKTRTLSPALRRALEIRDGGCRFPGCGLRFTEGHHIVHWENGGETRLSNLVSLCRRHHRAVHEEGFRVQVFSDGRLRFLDRLGWPLPDCPPPSRLTPDPVERLMADHKRRGIDPDEDTPAARYRRRADIPWDLEARAREAVDG